MLYGVFAAKMLALRMRGLPSATVPVLGGLLAGVVVVLWFSSALWFFGQSGHGGLLTWTLPEVSRRSVLEGAGVALAAGTIGYVGFVALGPAPDATDDDDDDDSSGPGLRRRRRDSHVLAAVDDIPDGGGIVLTDDKLVLTRDGDAVRCFSAVCTHQGCLVAGVQDGQIRCPCHGSAFDAATGAVVQGPATEPLEAEEIEITDQGEVRRA